MLGRSFDWFLFDNIDVGLFRMFDGDLFFGFFVGITYRRSIGGGDDGGFCDGIFGGSSRGFFVGVGVNNNGRFTGDIGYRSCVGIVRFNCFLSFVLVLLSLMLNSGL